MSALELTMMRRVGELNKEIARLRSVADDNKTECEATRIENARLKAEVERLGAFRTHTIIPNEKLQAEVERLTKAGDKMAKLLSCCGNPQSEVRGWDAAKEGKAIE